MNTNSKPLHSILFASISALSLPAAADAADTWIEYRLANKLPIEAQSSAPASSSDELFGQMAISDGSAQIPGMVRSHDSGQYARKDVTLPTLADVDSR